MNNKVMWAATAVAAACQGSDPGNTDGVGTIDSAPSGGSVTEGPCKLHVTTQVAPDGSKTESRYYFASFDGVAPGDHIDILLCGYSTTTIPTPTPPATCSSGYTCTESGDQIPTGGMYCAAAPDFAFHDNTVSAYCGQGQIAYDTTGAIKSENDTHYTDVKLIRR